LDRVGLLDKINESVTAIYQGRAWLATDSLEHEGRRSYEDGLAMAMDVFKTIHAIAETDLNLLIVAEYTFLAEERQFCDPSDKATITSLTDAIQNFDDGLVALSIVEEGESYKIVDKCFSHRDGCRHNGMPKDVFYYACAGHLARIIGIRKAPGINIAEKELLKQRYENIVAAQSVYFAKQKKALEK
jgi:hypothetical protein